MSLAADQGLPDPQPWPLKTLAPRNGKGAIDKWLFKNKLHTELCQKKLAEFDLPSDEQEKNITTFNDVSTFRSKCGFRKGAKAKTSPF